MIYEKNGDYVKGKIYHEDGEEMPSIIPQTEPSRVLHLSTDGRNLTITVRGNQKITDGGVEQYDGRVIFRIGAVFTEFDVVDGKTTRTIDTEEPVEVQAVSLKDHPAQPSKSVVIEP